MDKNQQQMMIIGVSVAGVLIIGILAYFLFFRSSGNSASTTTGTSSAATTTGAVGPGAIASGGPGGMMPPMPGGAMPRGGMGPGGMGSFAGPMMSSGGYGMGPGMMGGQSSKQAAPPVNTAQKDTRMPSHRSDPFKPWWNPNPPPPVVSIITPMRLARIDPNLPPEKPETVTEVPTGRVAGILRGNGVYALLDMGNGDMQVVRPGSKVDHYRVAQILPNSVILTRTIGLRTYRQVVPLTDITTRGGFPYGGGAMRRGGYPYPGMGSMGAPPGMMNTTGGMMPRYFPGMTGPR